MMRTNGETEEILFDEGPGHEIPAYLPTYLIRKATLDASNITNLSKLAVH